MRVARKLVQGRRRVAEQPAPTARGERDERYEGRPERRGLNCSILDGWWDEGYDPSLGWAIGGRMDVGDEGHQDWLDSRGALPPHRDADRADVLPPGGRRGAARLDPHGQALDQGARAALLDGADGRGVHPAVLHARERELPYHGGGQSGEGQGRR